MSYILDALKKSEQSRLKLETPLRQLLLRGEEMPSDSRRVWPYVAGAALLLNAAALYVWWRMPPGAAVEREAQPTKPVKPNQAAPEKGLVAALSASDATRGAVTSAVLADLPIVRKNPNSPPPVALSPAVAAAPPVAAAPAAQPVMATGNATRAVSRATTVAVVPPAADETGKKVAREPQALDLPEALRKELPPLVMSGMLREEGTTGWVVVNERGFREGEEVAPGLRVEKILERGAQFTYKGYRFQR